MGLIKMSILLAFLILSVAHFITADLNLRIRLGHAEEHSGAPLYLTPFIESGQIDEAREASLVSHKDFENVTSYSGFITVNETYNSNIFFWFFPADKSISLTDANIPVILWSEGGPGASCMTSIFSPGGPFLPNSGYSFTSNSHSLHKIFHVIYLDNPVNVGFSHTSDINGHINTTSAAAQDIYEFLLQFFQLFPKLQPNPFYTFGVSYGAKYSVEIAHLIHTKNLENPQIFINLTGLIHDSPFYEGITGDNYSDILFTAGVISKGFRDVLREQEVNGARLMLEGRWREAFDLFLPYVLNHVPAATGYAAMYNLLDNPQTTVAFHDWIYLGKDSVCKAIHVGNATYHGAMNWDVLNGMGEDFLKSVIPKLDDILNNGYKLLVVVGNMDVVTNHISIMRAFEETSKWRWSREAGIRSILKDWKDVVGYEMRWGEKVKMVVMRNMAHATFHYKPGRTWEAVKNFIAGN